MAPKVPVAEGVTAFDTGRSTCVGNRLAQPDSSTKESAAMTCAKQDAARLGDGSVRLRRQGGRVKASVMVGVQRLWVWRGLIVQWVQTAYAASGRKCGDSGQELLHRMHKSR